MHIDAEGLTRAEIAAEKAASDPPNDWHAVAQAAVEAYLEYTVSRKWTIPSELRTHFEPGRVECLAVLAGKWKPLEDSYWDDCVISVRWRFKP